tara:strand:+ start:1469 stop:1894 length:426 start_codon:yes stop_codon:yes gene_type:complete
MNRYIKEEETQLYFKFLMKHSSDYLYKPLPKDETPLDKSPKNWDKLDKLPIRIKVLQNLYIKYFHIEYRKEAWELPNKRISHEPFDVWRNWLGRYPQADKKVFETWWEKVADYVSKKDVFQEIQLQKYKAFQAWKENNKTH